ncbi:DHHA1 domain-containing protein [Shigella flexneri]
MHWSDMNTLPGMMLKFGGHAMAAGLSLEEDKFELFQQRFGELVTEWLDPSPSQGEVVSDGPLSPAEMTMEVAQCARCWPVGAVSRSRC